jgi:hypothetical protein
MSGVFYLLSILATLYVVFWFMKGEKEKTGGYKGLIAFKDEIAPKKKKKKKYDPHSKA